MARFTLSDEMFDDLVADAFEALPAAFRDRIDNVEIEVEDWPDRMTMDLAGVHSRGDLLGFYHGVPLTERTTHYGLVAPDCISIYRCPIEMQCRTPGEVREMVQRVLRHEIAHHFGLDDDRLREIGAY
jgi:predicted Zn-dependent protease with MMP-like domain